MNISEYGFIKLYLWSSDQEQKLSQFIKIFTVIPWGKLKLSDRKHFSYFLRDFAGEDPGFHMYKGVGVGFADFI